MADIFISYAREDRSRIEPLAKSLQDLGWSVFWDRTIPTGGTWRQVIGDALKNARSVIVAWSQNSIESDWVQEEADRGRRRNILIPILIDNVDPPLGFGAIQAADLTSWNPTQSSPEFEKLISDISIILGPSPKHVKEAERAAEEERKRKQEEERKRKEDEQRKAEEESQRLEEEERRKAKSPETELDATATTDVKPPEPRRTSRVWKVFAVACAIVLIIAMWFLIPRIIPSKGKLFVEVVPKSAAIKILEVDQPFQSGMELKPGKYNIQASFQGYETQVEPIELRANEEKALNFQLRKKIVNNSNSMEFVLIPAGQFTMGSNTWGNSAIPLRVIEFLKPFYLQTTEVNQGEWKRVMGENPSYFKQCGDDCPVEQVSWEDAKRFIEKLNQLEKTNAYRLPSEAEWEYACRAGTTTEYSFGDDASMLEEYAWYDQNSTNRTHRVRTRKPNRWGLYDMSGNVWEWIEDDYHNGYEGAPADSQAWINNPRAQYRVIRGGSWNFKDTFCRSFMRDNFLPDKGIYHVGFRLAMSIPTTP